MTILQQLQGYNLVNLILILVIAGSILQGVLRGTSKSAGRLLSLVGGGIMTALSLAASIPLTAYLSPKVQQWLTDHAQTPDRELSGAEQVVYTLAGAIREFQLVRYVLVFFICYWLIRFVLGLLGMFLPGMKWIGGLGRKELRSGLTSRLFGGIIGAVIGAFRGIVLIALLFVIVSLFPNSGFSKYVEASPVYRQGAEVILEPLSGKLIKGKLPVLTQDVQNELNGIFERKYEVIDARIPDDIDAAAAQIVEGADSDREKAEKLYNWIGTRIQYDYDKVEAYEKYNDWHEQTPEMTFKTRKGVCIDYARLYAVMARSQGLDVKVITGLGYDGQGGYGSHAWNEVYVDNTWIPLDSTWAKSGNWFDPPKFAETHVQQKVLG
ncbi:transglutaminase domain-containing protein [Paenibacillus physcomitrellae]|uniref:Transglutaminase domain protein n=1 Tax=Paenibacillus physcomitrellae TaxID=1619311 RepID=A0ABQ1G269_9BACL|nr:transglutaminase domain-containing protein [Paenibacillus physcomitrellae]GGA35173.1 transglutaminase domain protein [Paenibacillus physcomitrellae]